jgi:HD-GYP domain-containing protein (c-di-GMP phosphodiesterase class II)
VCRYIALRLRPEEISAGAQIVQLAEAVTVHLAHVGREGAMAMLHERRGRAFRPDVVDCALDNPAALTAELEDPWAEVLATEPGDAPVLGGERIDDVLVAIADFADLKSPYTAGHSRSVASLAGDAARLAGLPDADRVALRRAGWIHDVGRISVSVAVWDKPGPLVRDEREQVRLHPYVTERIFARSPFLSPVSVCSRRVRGAQPRGRVDGSGYHRGAERVPGLSVAARISSRRPSLRSRLVAERTVPAVPRHRGVGGTR